MKENKKLQKATFAAGCFWHVEEAFRHVKGVISTTVGYTGGKSTKPTYFKVCTGLTGHAEALEIEYEPKKVSYKKLLDIFWEVHNPTTLNRQGLDFGNQYRSAIFYHNEEQKKEAQASKQQLKKLEEIYEHGLINKEEYKKKKKEIEDIPEEKIEENKEEVKDVKLKSDKILIIGAIIIVLLFGAIFGLRYFNQEQPKTIDDLHELNLNGKLDDEKGYVYNGYSFVNSDGVWYTQFKSPGGTILYNFNFRYSPRDLEDIKIKGKLDIERFNDASQYYVTFNPLGNELTHVRLARLDYDVMMTRIFQKIPVSACDRNASNATTACLGIPIITCENTDDIVGYYKESDELSLEYKDNCIIISGSGFDFVKGVDRVLYNLYGVMEQ